MTEVSQAGVRGLGLLWDTREFLEEAAGLRRAHSLVWDTDIQFKGSNLAPTQLLRASLIPSFWVLFCSLCTHLGRIQEWYLKYI